MTSPITKRVGVATLDQLRQLGDKYAQGIGSASRKILSEVFIDGAIIYGEVSGKLMGGPIELLYQAVEGHGPSPNMTYHVDTIQVEPTTAVLRVHLDNLVTGFGYTDHLSALLINGEWRLVAKIFQEYKSQ